MAPVNVFDVASIRTNLPAARAPSGRDLPATLIVPFPVNSCATMRTLPPTPPPPSV
jgi:hypothetical protein